MYKRQPIPRYLANSLLVAVSVVIIQVICCALFTYAVTFMKAKGKNILFRLVLFTYMAVSYTHLDVYKRQLLVVGYPKGSIWNYAVHQDMDKLKAVFTFLSLSFTSTLAAAVLILLVSGFRYYRRMRMIADSIGKLASGGLSLIHIYVADM